MVIYALVSEAASCAVDLYLSRGDAETDLAEVERDDDQLAALLSIVPLDFDGVHDASVN